ncbi:MAG TPA: glycosyltransferase family 2 protein, partial [Sphingobacteriaceae bacterium]
VILNWNGKHHLAEYLPSVVRSGYPNLEIIVGDNASSDGSVDYLIEKFPEVRIIRNDENYGFAGGYNQVLSQVDADYFVLLNSDVEVTPNWIEPVITLMETDNTIAAAQPKLLSYTNREKFEYAGAAGGFIDFLGYPFCRGRVFDTVETDTGQYDQSSEVFWATGAALFVKRNYWNEVGGLDADFFAHMEEIDLCWRLKNRGYKIMYCAESTVFHLGGGTLSTESPYKTYLNFRNNLVMLHKNLPAMQAIVIIFLRFWLDFISLLRFLIDGKKRNAMAINKAHTNFFRSFFRTVKKRHGHTRNFNSFGFYGGSIVWNYFVLKKKTFSQLPGKQTIS